MKILKTNFCISSALISLSMLLTGAHCFANTDAQIDPFAELERAINQNQVQPIAPAQSKTTSQAKSQIKHQIKPQVKTPMLEFEQWKAEYFKDYRQFRQTYFSQLDKQRDSLLNTWGSSELSSPSAFVQYNQSTSSNLATKAVLDFERQQIRISVLHDKNEEISKSNLKQALANLNQSFAYTEGQNTKQTENPLVQQFSNKQSFDRFINFAHSETLSPELDTQTLYEQESVKIKQQAESQKNLIEKIAEIDSDKGSAVVSQKVIDKTAAKATAKLTENTTKKVINEAEIAKEQAQIEQEKQQRLAALKQQLDRIKTLRTQLAQLKEKSIPKPQTNMPLAQDVHLAGKVVTTYTIDLPKTREIKLAKPYLQNVIAQSKRWGLDPSLTLAVMHTESYFNPMAKSHIPAYGLMQIVPNSASIDVNRYLYKKDAAMTQAQLFQPTKNIETGVAYIHILNSRYLKGITNELSRTYCVIAAYNTGAGNVAKTFTADKSRNLTKAIKVINKLTPEQVYSRLVAQLPYDETRQYIQKVTKRQPLYVAVDQI